MTTNSLNQVSEKLHHEIIKLSMNVVIDKTGNYNEDHFTADIYRLQDNILYRLSSLNWHINSLLKHHKAFETIFKKNPGDPIIYDFHNASCFMFDDLVFNLMALYDYYANYIAYFLLSSNKQTIGWNSLANGARKQDNKFYKYEFAKILCDHNHNWVERINDFRSKVIHRNIQKGKEKSVISWSKGQILEFRLLYSIPKKLAKKLCLESPIHEGLGVDLHLGSIEIVEKSIEWISSFSETIRQNNTTNSVIFSHTKQE